MVFNVKKNVADEITKKFKNMKMQKIVFSLFFIGLTTLLSAQVKEEMKEMSQGIRSALVIELPNVSDKLVGDLWKSFTKDYYKSKTKWDRKGKEYLTAEAKIGGLGSKNISLRATTEENKDDVIFSLWVDTGNAFINSKDFPSEYKQAEKIVLKFAMEVTREKIKLELEEEEEKLEDLNDDLTKLEKAKEKYEDNIKKAEEAIEKAKKDIEQNLADQEKMKASIEDQKKEVQKVQKKLSDL